MGQDEREVSDLPEGKDKEQGGGAPVPSRVAGAGSGLARGAASSEQEGDSRAGDAGCHAVAGLGNDDEEDAKEALKEESEKVAPVGDSGRGDAPESGRNEDLCFEFRGFRPARRAVAHAMPPSSYRLLPFRSRKQYNPTRFIFAGDAASGIANARDPGTGTSEAASGPQPTASLGSPSGTSRSAGDSAATNAGHGAKSEAMVLTAGRSEIDVAVDESCSDDHNTESKDVGAARVSSPSSCRYPSRRRKQRRPDRCISDPAEDSGAAATARAKARRGNIVLDRFLTYLVRTTPEQRPEWVRNVTADDVGVQGQRDSSVSRTVSEDSPEGPPDGSRILAIVAILGASLALSLVSCVLFYIVGQRTASGLPDTHQNK